MVFHDGAVGKKTVFIDVAFLVDMTDQRPHEDFVFAHKGGRFISAPVKLAL
jgi:hypothetical protein